MADSFARPRRSDDPVWAAFSISLTFPHKRNKNFSQKPTSYPSPPPLDACRKEFLLNPSRRPLALLSTLGSFVYRVFCRIFSRHFCARPDFHMIFIFRWYHSVSQSGEVFIWISRGFTFLVVIVPPSIKSILACHWSDLSVITVALPTWLNCFLGFLLVCRIIAGNFVSFCAKIFSWIVTFFLHFLLKSKQFSS